MNNELIKIKEENGKKLVSARELHEFLESKERFSKWWEKVSDEEDYGFINGEDYTPYQMVHPQNKQEITDYVVTIDMGKEISMISKLPKGKKARKYFIECEKELKEISKKALLLEKIYNGGQEGILASKQLTDIEVEEATKPLVKQLDEQRPLVEFSQQISQTSNAITMSQFAKVIKDENIKLGRNKLFEWFRENDYLRHNNEPYQKYMKYFEVKESTYKTPYGEKLSTQTYINGIGQIYFVEKLRKEFC